jgi:hypothetical protein
MSMVETIILEYLSGQLSVPVVMEVPENMPARFVLVEKTGSGRRDMIDRVTVAIQSWSAKSLYQAASLNADVKAAMDGITALGAVSSAKLNTDYNFTDPTTKTYRYQAVYDLVYYEDMEE